MTALRRTQSTIGHLTRASRRVGLGYFVVLGLSGCGTASQPGEDQTSTPGLTPMPGSNDPAWLTSRAKLPPPDTDRIDYDTQNRTLTLYDIPSRDNWIVQLPHEANGRPVGTQYRLPEGIDKTHTLIYYSRAGMKVSEPVTVAQVEAGRMSHTSLGNGPGR